MNDVRLLRVGFEQGLYTLADVRAWVDRQVEKLDRLPAELLELTTIAHVRHEQIVKLLKALEGPSEPAVTARLELTVTAALYSQGTIPLGDCLARLCSLVTWSEGFTDEERSSVYSIGYAYDLAEYGTYGNAQDVQAELENFFAAYPLPKRDNT